MDYLVIEGYKSAAINFAQEANMSPRVNIESIQERVEIRNAIHRGDIQTAIEMIHDLVPEVCKILYSSLASSGMLRSHYACF